MGTSNDVNISTAMGNSLFASSAPVYVDPFPDAGGGMASLSIRIPRILLNLDKAEKHEGVSVKLALSLMDVLKELVSEDLERAHSYLLRCVQVLSNAFPGQVSIVYHIIFVFMTGGSKSRTFLCDCTSSLSDNVNIRMLIVDSACSNRWVFPYLPPGFWAVIADDLRFSYFMKKSSVVDWITHALVLLERGGIPNEDKDDNYFLAIKLLVQWRFELKCFHYVVQLSEHFKHDSAVSSDQLHVRALCAKALEYTGCLRAAEEVYTELGQQEQTERLQNVRFDPDKPYVVQFDLSSALPRAEIYDGGTLVRNFLHPVGHAGELLVLQCGTFTPDEKHASTALGTFLSSVGWIPRYSPPDLPNIPGTIGFIPRVSETQVGLFGVHRDTPRTFDWQSHCEGERERAEERVHVIHLVNTQTWQWSTCTTQGPGPWLDVGKRETVQLQDKVFVFSAIDPYHSPERMAMPGKNCLGDLGVAVLHLRSLHWSFLEHPFRTCPIMNSQGECPAEFTYPSLPGSFTVTCTPDSGVIVMLSTQSCGSAYDITMFDALQSVWWGPVSVDASKVVPRSSGWASVQLSSTLFIFGGHCSGYLKPNEQSSGIFAGQPVMQMLGGEGRHSSLRDLDALDLMRMKWRDVDVSGASEVLEPSPKSVAIHDASHGCVWILGQTARGAILWQICRAEGMVNRQSLNRRRIKIDKCLRGFDIEGRIRESKRLDSKQYHGCCNPTCCVVGHHLKKCNKCGQAYYCSRECQKSHWKTHKQTCGQQLCSAEAISVHKCPTEEKKDGAIDYDYASTLMARYQFLDDRQKQRPSSCNKAFPATSLSQGADKSGQSVSCCVKNPCRSSASVGTGTKLRLESHEFFHFSSVEDIYSLRTASVACMKVVTECTRLLGQNA